MEMGAYSSETPVLSHNGGYTPIGDNTQLYFQHFKKECFASITTAKLDL